MSAERNGRIPDILDRAFYERLSKTAKVYAGCGNMLGVVPLTEAGYSLDQDFRQDATLREYLQRWGTGINSDSVMVLIGDPTKIDQQGYHYEMHVFEPNGESNNGLAGGISTMCGNGVRAVAAFIQKQFPDTVEARVMTLSGLRTVEIDGNLYTVSMGEFTSSANDLKKYVNNGIVKTNSEGNFIDSPIPEEILSDLNNIIAVDKWSIGLNGDRDENGEIDGEPHVVIELPEQLISDIDQLRDLAVMVGPLVTKNSRLFPKEININFIVVNRTGNEPEILNCTHERNLGDDADHSVTPACGTGSTVAGGFMLERYPRATSVLIHCTGGDLIISKSRSGQELLLKGPAEEVPTTATP